jgi:hypothetical protein
VASGIGIADILWLVGSVICVLFVTARLPATEIRSERRPRPAMYHVRVGVNGRRRSREWMSRPGRRR